MIISITFLVGIYLQTFRTQRDADEENFTHKEEYLTSPGNQEGCQCCYAYAALGCVQSSFAIKGVALPPLAIRELVDLLHTHEEFRPKTETPDKEGCYPNNYNNAFKYIKKFGISFQKSYKAGKQGEKDQKVTISGLTLVKTFDEKAIEKAIRQQPLTGKIKVHKSFAVFKGKEIYQLDPKEEELGSHAVQVIGFGVENGIKYYKIRNSWGLDWGDNGSAKVRRDLITNLSYPVVSPKDVEVAKSLVRRLQLADEAPQMWEKGESSNSHTRKDL